MFGGMQIPAMAATGDSVVQFQKVLQMENAEGANVPNVTYTYTITAGSAIGATANSPEVKAGVGLPTISSVTYTKGDTIPVEGESYKYPDSFDIIVLRDSVAVKVRDHKITDIVPTSEYSYGGVPVVNGRGFEVLADSNEKIQQFLSEYSNLKSINDADFFAKWVKFDTYRKIAIQNR